MLKDPKKIKWFILGAGLLIRLVLPLLISNNPYKGDGAEYKYYATRLEKFGVYSGELGEPPKPSYERMPGVPLEIYLTSRITGYDSYFILLPNILFGWLLLFILFKMFEAMKFTGRIPNILLSLYAFIPIVDYYSAQFYPEVPSAFFSLLCFWGFFRFHSTQQFKHLALSGFAAGMALYFRPELALTAIAILLFLWIRKESIASRLKHSFLFAGIIFLVLLPWIVRNAKNEGKFIPLGSNQIFDQLDSMPDSVRGCTRGLYTWLNTWHWTERHSKLVAWDFMHAKLNELPKSAFDSEEERQKISQLQSGKEYNCGIDKALMKIAEEKKAAYPLRQYFVLPLKRMFFLLFRVEKFDSFSSKKIPPFVLTFAWILLAGFGNLYTVMGIIGAWTKRKIHPIFPLILTSILLRLVFFAFIYHVETRYMMIFFPELFFAGSAWIISRNEEKIPNVS